MRQDVSQVIVGVGLVLHQGPVGDVGHSMLFKKLDRVVAKSRFERFQISRRSRVGSHFKDAIPFGIRFDRRGIIRRLEELGFYFRNKLAIHLASLVRFLPIGVRHEGFPRCIARIATWVGQKVDQLALGILHGNPITDVFNTMLFEKLHRMVSKPAV